MQNTVKGVEGSEYPRLGVAERAAVRSSETVANNRVSGPHAGEAYREKKLNKMDCGNVAGKWVKH